MKMYFLFVLLLGINNLLIANEDIRPTYKNGGLNYWYFGISYPYYNPTLEGYLFSNNTFNYGIQSGIRVGFNIGNGISFGLHSQLIYTYYGNRDFEYRIENVELGVLHEYISGNREHKHFSMILLPEIEFKFWNNIVSSFGVYYRNDLASKEIVDSEGFRYYVYNPQHMIYIPLTPPKRLGYGEIITKGNSSEQFYGLMASLKYLIRNKNSEKYHFFGIEFKNDITKHSIYRIKESVVTLTWGRYF